MQLDDKAIIAAVGELLGELQDKVDKIARAPGPQGEPGPPGTLELAVPDDIAEQVAKAIAVLNESSVPVATAVRSEKRGKKGPQGERGPAGRDGADGIKGDEGPAGRDGVSVNGAVINRDGELVIMLSNGTTLVPGRVHA